VFVDGLRLLPLVQLVPGVLVGLPANRLFILKFAKLAAVQEDSLFRRIPAAAFIYRRDREGGLIKQKGWQPKSGGMFSISLSPAR
jgi:hypothetical protein